MPTPPSRWTVCRPFVAPFARYLALGLLLLFVNRVALSIAHSAQLGEAAEFPRLLLTGVRFDLLFLCYTLIPAWLLACLTPARSERVVKSVLLGYFTVGVAVVALLECATWPSLREFGSRPEALFLEFLQHWHEVAGMVIHGFLLEVVITSAALAVVGWFAVRTFRKALRPAWPSWPQRLLLFPLGGALLFIGARSSLGHRPANLSTASFSTNRLHNELALNSPYTLLYAAYRLKHEQDNKGDYGTMPLVEALEIVRRENLGTTRCLALAGGEASSLHQQAAIAPGNDRLNVVIILLESVGAEFTGRLAGSGLTPNLDRLAERGIAFDRLFSTGTRTSRGIEAVMCGFFPTPARSVVKLGLAQREFFTVADLLRRDGYSTHFIYGGEANFDEMKSFFVGNGVQHIWDQPVLQKPEHAVGVWGIHDEDLFNEADRIFRDQGDQPFFALVLSTSNHTPFDYEDGRITPDPRYPAASHENAVKYTDFALGQFFARAEQSPYFHNTLFLVVADHGTRVSGDQLIPLHKFHIPGVIIGPPGRVQPQTIHCLASQVDLVPTLLGLTGREWTHPMLGRNLLTRPASERADPAAGRALLQYETHFGYWKNEDIVILRPGLAPAMFRVEPALTAQRVNFTLEPEPPDTALVREALAHSVLPTQLYRERRYRLP